MFKKYALISIVSLATLPGTTLAMSRDMSREQKEKQEWEQKIAKKNIKNVLLILEEHGHGMQPYYRAMLYDREFYREDMPRRSELCSASLYISILTGLDMLDSIYMTVFIQTYKKPLTEWSPVLQHKLKKLGVLDDLDAYEDNNALRASLPEKSLDIIAHMINNMNIPTMISKL